MSDNASISTRFNFPAPVYIPESEEHCFVLFSDSNEYKVWISRMGDIDITGTRTISERSTLVCSSNHRTHLRGPLTSMKT